MREIDGYENLDADLQLARRMVCFHCRPIHREQPLFAVPRPSSDLQVIGEMLRAKGWDVPEGSGTLEPAVSTRVEPALIRQAKLSKDAEKLYLDDLMEQEQERQAREAQRQEEERIARTAELAHAIAETRAMNARARAGIDRRATAAHPIPPFIVCGGHLETVNINDPDLQAQWNWDSPSDADYIDSGQD